MTNAVSAKPVIDAADYGLKFLSLQELANQADDSCEYLVDGLLPVGGTSELVGKPKTGKSTFARQLALCVAQGKPFLDRETRQGAVLYFALEEKKSEVHKHFAQLGMHGDEQIHTLARLHASDRSAAVDYIRRFKPALVIIDTLVKFTGMVDVDDYGKVTKHLQPLHDAARDCGAHILLVHHAKKGEEEVVVDNSCGSTALAAAVDTFLVLQLRRGVLTISGSCRYGPPLESTVLSFDRQTRSYSMGSTEREVAHEEAKSAWESMKNVMAEFVEKHPGCTQEEIMSATKGNGATKHRAFTELKNECLREAGEGVRGKPFRYYADIPVEENDGDGLQPVATVLQ